MKLPQIIQGGMGVAISDWRLANAVSSQGGLGIVSGTGIHVVLACRLMDGDPGGHVRRALKSFPFQEAAQRVLEKYYNPTPRLPRLKLPRTSRYKRPPMWSIKAPKSLTELTVIANFVEVHLAKDGHANPVGINLLEKLQLPTLASLYGAMLAKVDFVTMGAGIPTQVPGILDQFAEQKASEYRLDVRGSARSDAFRLQFDPRAIFPDVAKKLGSLSRPRFLPIVSSVVLAKSLIKRATGKVDGLIIEAPVAGGHNAPPRSGRTEGDKGEPVYGEKDAVDLEKIQQLGLPFWLAGGYDSRTQINSAIESGATGVQIGTAFAYCEESGLSGALKSRVMKDLAEDNISIRTDSSVSPTGFPFKVVQLSGTLSDAEMYKTRERICDVGLMRQLYKREDGTVGYRCPAEPNDPFTQKGGEREFAAGKGCLCNNLLAAASLPQERKDGYIEPPLATAGDGLKGIRKYLRPGRNSYNVSDVLNVLRGVPLHSK